VSDSDIRRGRTVAAIKFHQKVRALIVIADLQRITQAARTPHGYTLAIWAAGVFCIGNHGLPGMLAVLLFTVGATAAFGLIRLIAAGCRSGSAPESGAMLPTGGSVHVLALPGAVLVSWLLAPLPAPWCWPASSSAATLAFIVLHGTQDALWRRSRTRSRSVRRHRVCSNPGSSVSGSAPLSS
jgi:hypothetical protein